MPNGTTVEPQSERELVVTRSFDAPARVVFEAWTRADLMKRWWAPASTGVPLLSCDMDVRVGGGYRLEFGRDAGATMAFFGTYVEVSPPSRLVWTNDEGGETTITTVTFAEENGRTRLVLHERYPSTEKRDEAVAGMDGVTPEQFEQLDALLVTLRAGG